MKEKFWLLAAAAVVALAPMKGMGETPQRVEAHYKRGVELYDARKYASAQAEFQKAIEEIGIDDAGMRMRTKYYMASCAAKSRQTNAKELLSRFEFDYPTSIYMNDIRFELADILLSEGDFGAALEQYQKVDPLQLRRALVDEYNFKIGTAAFQSGDMQKAYTHFNNCTTDPLYLPHAIYYKAYIDYSNENFSAAKQGFALIAEQEVYAPIVPFYLLQIAFREGDYQQVIESGVPLYEKAVNERRAEIARSVSEAYFHTKDYRNALAYMERYEQDGGKMGREELYLAGFCNRYEGMYQKAVEQLAVVAAGNDELAQNAGYHMGDCLIKLGDKKRAVSAFSLAASADFNKNIKEEAMFNYGKLQYEQGGGVFNGAIATFDTYVKQFPQSPRINEAREFLLSAYFNSKNYTAAYEAIRNVQNPDNNIKTALQKIAYFRGLEYFENGDYDNALSFFDIADANRFNAKYTALTKFWRAETYVRQGNYTKAAPLYKEYTVLSPRTEYEHQIALYNMGYCYFNDKQWGEAATAFNRFMSLYTKNDAMRANAYNRLGDIAFARREFSQAIDNYDKARKISPTEVPYAEFQRAVALGMWGKNDQKIRGLLDVISEGQGDYIDDAMYELGTTYVRMDRFSEGATMLRNLIARFPESPFALSALGELGLTYQNLGQQDEALKYYKMVVNKYPSSPQAKDAMLGIRNIYVDRNDVDSYFAYAKASGVETNVTVVERDSLTFESALRVYQDGQFAKALPLMDKYLSQYPRGAYRTDATYILGDCSLREGNRVAALVAFEEVGAMPGSQYKTLALQRAAKMQSEDKNYAAAAALYKNLSTTATQSAVVVEALNGYLQNAILTGDTQAMGAAADEVLASPFVNTDLTRAADYAKARGLYAQGDLAQALPLFRKAAEARTREGAESRYRVAFILFGQDKLSDVEKEVLAMAENYAQYEYWMGKAFLLLGDVYVKKNDAFQAKATYQSIIDGYSDKNDGVVEEAQSKLGALAQ